MNDGRHREKGDDVGDSPRRIVDAEALAITNTHHEHREPTAESDERTVGTEARCPRDEDHARERPTRDPDTTHTPEHNQSSLGCINERDNHRNDADGGGGETGHALT
jgi:hypothetical protein